MADCGMVSSGAFGLSVVVLCHFIKQRVIRCLLFACLCLSAHTHMLWCEGVGGVHPTEARQQSEPEWAGM